MTRRRRTLLANERKSARQPDARRASRIVQALNWLTRPVYSSGDPLRSPCLGSSLSLISLAVSFASKVRRRRKKEGEGFWGLPVPPTESAPEAGRGLPSSSPGRGCHRPYYAHAKSPSSFPIDTCQAHVQQGIGFAVAVQFRTTNDLKAHPHIKAQCLVVLFVHINCRRAAIIYRITEQSSPNALLAIIGVNEQHFNFSLCDANKLSQHTVSIAH